MIDDNCPRSEKRLISETDVCISSDLDLYDSPTKESYAKKSKVSPRKRSDMKKKLSNTNFSKKKYKETTQDRLLEWNSYYSNEKFGIWIQCTKCNKWRKALEYEEDHQVPSDWCCSMSMSGIKDCNDPENIEEADFSPVEYVPGSIVWAKLETYPWWPAMVEDDPDTEEYYWIEGDGTLFYNVTFLDDKVSHAWVEASFVRSFLKTAPKQEQSKGKRRIKYFQLRKAEMRAKTAVTMPIKERLQNFSFAKRYKGKWSSAAIFDDHEDSISITEMLLKEVEDIDSIHSTDSENGTGSSIGEIKNIDYKTSSLKNCNILCENKGNVNLKHTQEKANGNEFELKHPKQEISGDDYQKFSKLESWTNFAEMKTNSKKLDLSKMETNNDEKTLSVKKTLPSACKKTNEKLSLKKKNQKDILSLSNFVKEKKFVHEDMAETEAVKNVKNSTEKLMSCKIPHSKRKSSFQPPVKNNTKSDSEHTMKERNGKISCLKDNGSNHMDVDILDSITNGNIEKPVSDLVVEHASDKEDTKHKKQKRKNANKLEIEEKESGHFEDKKKGFDNKKEKQMSQDHPEDSVIEEKSILKDEVSNKNFKDKKVKKIKVKKLKANEETKKNKTRNVKEIKSFNSDEDFQILKVLENNLFGSVESTCGFNSVADEGSPCNNFNMPGSEFEDLEINGETKNRKIISCNKTDLLDSKLRCENTNDNKQQMNFLEKEMPEKTREKNMSSINADTSDQKQAKCMKNTTGHKRANNKHSSITNSKIHQENVIMSTKPDVQSSTKNINKKKSNKKYLSMQNNSEENAKTKSLVREVHGKVQSNKISDKIHKMDTETETGEKITNSLDDGEQKIYTLSLNLSNQIENEDSDPFEAE